jgi:hypothetical protein
MEQFRTLSIAEAAIKIAEQNLTNGTAGKDTLLEETLEVQKKLQNKIEEPKTITPIECNIGSCADALRRWKQLKQFDPDELADIVASMPTTRSSNLEPPVVVATAKKGINITHKWNIND